MCSQVGPSRSPAHWRIPGSRLSLTLPAVSFNAQAGTYYRIAVAGVGGTCGSIILSWDLIVTTELLPQITQGPSDVTGNTNDVVSLVVAFDAFELTGVQWFYQGQIMAGATN